MRIRKLNNYVEGLKKDIYISDSGDVYKECRKRYGKYLAYTGNILMSENNNPTRQYLMINEIRDSKPYFYNEWTLVIRKDLILNKLELNPNSEGYVMLSLEYEDGRRIPIGVHRLVNLIYNGGSLDKHTHHKDRVKSNNHYSNLESMTASEHIKLHSEEDKILPNYKLSTMSYVDFKVYDPNDKEYSFKNIKEASEKTGLSEHGFYRILSGDRKSYKGWYLNKKNTRCKYKSWYIEYPCGKVIYYEDIDRCIIETGCSMQGLYKILSGDRKSYRGYRCRGVKLK